MENERERPFKRVNSKEGESEGSPFRASDARENTLPPTPLLDVLNKRGIEDLTSIHTFLNPSLKVLRDPLSLKGMSQALERLTRAYQQGETVAIYADFDLDGTSGLALLKTGMEALGFKNLIAYQPKRLSEGYGVHVEAIDALADQGVHVIVTVDVGITAVDAATRCRDRGLDLIVTDHHLPKEQLPDAYAIVNPNQVGCESGLGHLAGVGVAFYLVLALRKYFQMNEIPFCAFDPKELLDCFVIGTLTDLTPLKDENRILIKHGLLQLQRTKRPGLKQLIQRLIGDRRLSSQDVAFTLAPKLNALSRLEQGRTPLEVLLIEDFEEADRLCNEIISNNSLRKDLQSYAEEKARELVAGSNERRFIWVWADDFHKGVIGLVATRLAQENNCPAFVGSIAPDGTISGSARSPDGYPMSLLTLLEAANEALLQFGGHAQAAGFKLETHKAAEMAQKLSDYFDSSTIESVHGSATHPATDATARLSDFNAHFMKWYEMMEPFGREFPVPVFRVEGVKVSKRIELRGGHIKWTVAHPEAESVSFDALAFSPRSDLKEIKPGQIVTIHVEVQWNYYMGTRKIQLLIRHVEAPSVNH